MLFHDPLFVVPAKVEARWINPENLTGTRGSGGQANDGRKGAPCYGLLAAGAQLELANYQGSSGIIRCTSGPRSMTAVQKCCAG